MTTVANQEVAAAPAIVEKGEEEEHPLQTGWSLWCVGFCSLEGASGLHSF
jgi:hypothetical protein